MAEYCPKCNNAELGNYCSKCGTKLEALPKCPHCAAKLYPTDKYCTNCGTEIERR